jgi:hypothetical protein
MAKSYLDAGNVDDLGRMVTALLAELWIVRDRLAVLEHIHGARIGIDPAEIDDFVPDAAFAAYLEKTRDRMVASVAGAPIAARRRSVDEILARAGLRPPPGAGRRA